MKPTPASSPNGNGAAARTARILLVEDHLDSGRVITRLLTHAGHQVRSAHSIREALEFAETDVFDLVISDIGLPDGSGADLFKQLRSRSPLPGIALSGYGSRDDVERSKAAGFTEHLTKPIEFHVLDAAIARVLSQQPA